jgi:hypothetical protein
MKSISPTLAEDEITGDPHDGGIARSAQTGLPGRPQLRLIAESCS